MSGRPTTDEVREMLAVLVDRGLVHVDGAELSEPRYFVDPLQLGRHPSASRSVCDGRDLKLVTDA